MSAKLVKLAEVVRMAARTYDAGRRDTAIRLISTVTSKLEISERQKFLSMVNDDISNSGIRIHLHSIVIGHSGKSASS